MLLQFYSGPFGLNSIEWCAAARSQGHSAEARTCLVSTARSRSGGYANVSMCQRFQRNLYVPGRIAVTHHSSVLRSRCCVCAHIWWLRGQQLIVSWFIWLLLRTLLSSNDVLMILLLKSCVRLSFDRVAWAFILSKRCFDFS